MATAQVLFQRFYYSKSFVKHDGEVRNCFLHYFPVFFVKAGFLSHKPNFLRPSRKLIIFYYFHTLLTNLLCPKFFLCSNFGEIRFSSCS